MSQHIRKHLVYLSSNNASTDVGDNGNTMVDTPSDRRHSDWQLNQEDLVPDKNPFLVMSQDQLQKLDAVLSSEQAKEILGETSSQFGLPGLQQRPNYHLVDGDPSEVLDKTIEENLSYIMNGTNLGMLGNKAVDFLQVFDSSGVPIQVAGSDFLVEDVEVEMAAEILVDGIQEDCELDIEFILRCIRLDHTYCVNPAQEVGEVSRIVTEISEKGEIKSEEDDSSVSIKEEQSTVEKNDTAASLVRRSQRQIEKSEREQLEKIKAENAELQRREKEEILKIQALGSIGDKLAIPNESCTDRLIKNCNDQAYNSLQLPEIVPAPTVNNEVVNNVGAPSDKISSLQSASEGVAMLANMSNSELPNSLRVDARSSFVQTEHNSPGQISITASQDEAAAIQPVHIKSSAESQHSNTELGLIVPGESGNAGKCRSSNIGYGRDQFQVTNNDTPVPSTEVPLERPSTPMPLPEEMTSEPCLTNNVLAVAGMKATIQGDFPLMPFDTVESLVSRLSGGDGVDVPPYLRGSHSGAEVNDQVDNAASVESKINATCSSQNLEHSTKRERSTDDIFGRVVQRRLSDGLKKESSFGKNSSSKQDATRKSYPKRENRKPPGRLMDMLEPALFSKPDRMKKIDPNIRSESVDEDGKQDGNCADSGRRIESPRAIEDCVMPLGGEAAEPKEKMSDVRVESLESKPDEIEEYLSKNDSQVFTVECEQQDGSLQILEIAGSPVSDQVGADASSAVETIQTAVVEEGKPGGERRQSALHATHSPMERRKKSKLNKRPAVVSKERIDGKQKMQGKLLKNALENAPALQVLSESDSGDSDDSESDSSWCSEDDPDRLWCICKQPHNNRFMINCDGCEDWFHGSCVGITRRLGRELEKSGKEWVCPKCTKAREEQKKAKTREDKEEKLVDKVIAYSEQGPLKVKHEKSSGFEVKKVSVERSAKKCVGEEGISKKLSKLCPNQQPPNSNIKSPSMPEKDAKQASKTIVPAIRSPLPLDKLTSQLCMMGCGRPARTDSIFCGNECILQHAHESRKDKDKMQPSQKRPEAPRNPVEIGRIPVIDRGTGRIMKGLGAPTEQTLVDWLRKHPTYEVLRPKQGHRAMPSSSPRTVHAPPRTVQAPPRTMPGQPPERSFYGQPQRKTIKLISAQPMPVENPSEILKAKAILSRTASVEKLEDKKVAATEQPKHPLDIRKSKPASDPRTIKQGLAGKARTSSTNSRTQQADDPRTKLSIDTTKAKSLADPRTKTVADTKIKSPTELKPKLLDARSKNVAEAKTTKSSIDSRQPPQPPPPPAAPPDPEPIRSNVRSTLKEVLTSRIKNTEDESMTSECIINIASHIEGELFKLFNDVGTKYKAKYRSLVFNMKDSRNHGLYRKILRGTISPERLVRMTPEELASKELAMWRERETKHTLEMIKREQEEQQLQHLPIIKKTHKGEIEIDDDGFTEKSKPKTESIVESPANVIVDTTDAHRSHLLDLNCKICTGKMLAPSDEETPSKKARVAKSISLESRSQDEDDSEEETDTNKVHRLSKEESSEDETKKDEAKKHDAGHAKEEKNKDKDKIAMMKKRSEGKGTTRDVDSKKKQDPLRKEKSKSDERKDETKSNEVEKKEKRKDETKPNDDKRKDGGKMEKSKDIIKKGKSKDSSVRKVKKVRIEKISSQDNISDREPSSTVTISSPDSAEPSQSDNSKSLPSVWKGFITMLEVAKFVTNAYKVSGLTDFLGQDIPDTIKVCGRITPNTVWEYLSKVKLSGSKEFLVIRFSPANEEEKVAYDSFYTYLSSRNRFGVVGNSSRMIKDFYILPLSSGSSIPATLLPFDGPGLEEIRPHMLLGVIIRHRGAKRRAGGKETSGKGGKSKKSLSKRKLSIRRGLNSTDLEVSNDSTDVGGDAKAPKKVKFDLTVKTDADVPYEPSYTPPLGDQKKKKRNSDDDSSPYEPSFTPPLEQRSRKRGSSDDSPYSPGHMDDDDDPDKPYDPEEAEEAAKMSKTIIPGLLAGSVSSQSVSELIDQISMSSNPTGITTTVLASIATTTNLEQKRKLLIELTQKVEEQKRQLEMQKQQIATKVTAQVMGVIAPFSVVHPDPTPSTIPVAEDNPRTILGKLKSGTEAYSPSYTPPLENSSNLDSLMPSLKLPDTSNISLPPNLQEILESIKKQGSSLIDPTVATSMSVTKEQVNPLLEDPIIKNFSTVELEEPLHTVADKVEKVVDVDSSGLAINSGEEGTLVILPPKQSDPRLKRKAMTQPDPRLKTVQEQTNKSTIGSLSADELMAIALKQFEDGPPLVVTPSTKKKKKKMAPQKATTSKVSTVNLRQVVTVDKNNIRTLSKEALPFKSIQVKPPASRKITLNIPTEIGAHKEPPPPGLDNGENDSSAPVPNMDATELPPTTQMVAYPIPFMAPPVRPPFSGPPPGFGPPPPMFSPFTPPPPFVPPVGGNFWPPNPAGQQDWRGGGPRFRGRGRGRWQNRGSFDGRSHFPPGNDWPRQDKDDRKDWHKDRDYRGDRDRYRERDHDWEERRDRRYDQERRSGERDERRGRYRRNSGEWDSGKRGRDRRSCEKDERHSRDRRSGDRDDSRRSRDGRSSERDERHNRDRSSSDREDGRGRGRSRSRSSDREQRRSPSSDREQRRSRSRDRDQRRSRSSDREQRRSRSSSCDGERRHSRDRHSSDKDDRHSGERSREMD